MIGPSEKSGIEIKSEYHLMGHPVYPGSSLAMIGCTGLEPTIFGPCRIETFYILIAPLQLQSPNKGPELSHVYIIKT